MRIVVTSSGDRLLLASSSPTTGCVYAAPLVNFESHSNFFLLIDILAIFALLLVMLLGTSMFASSLVWALATMCILISSFAIRFRTISIERIAQVQSAGIMLPIHFTALVLSIATATFGGAVMAWRYSESLSSQDPMLTYQLAGFATIFVLGLIFAKTKLYGARDAGTKR